MSFISYAQNYEDVMLWRALKHIDKGFYIDVGANDPKIDSVTKAFYDCGWCGINIEPVSEWHEKLQKERPNDINLKLVVGKHKKDAIKFYEIPETGLSTVNKSIAEKYKRESIYTIKEVETTVVSLTAICKEYAQPDIHFLKVDVEGAEKDILQGLNLKKFRPWVLVIEATIPGSTKENHDAWEELVISSNYDLAYADGLNRFYLAKEHPELLPAFKYPPNVFDDFLTSNQQMLAAHAAEAEAHAAEAEANMVQANIQYKEIINSRSWRMTAPLRWIMGRVKWFIRGCVAWLTLKLSIRPKRAAYQVLLHLRNWVFLRPIIKEKILSALEYTPSSRKWLKRLHHAHPFLPEKHSFVQSVKADRLNSTETSENKSLRKISGLQTNDGLDVSDKEVAEQSHTSILSGETTLENQLLEATNRWSLESRIHE